MKKTIIIILTIIFILLFLFATIRITTSTYENWKREQNARAVSVAFFR